jgi:hypothetical protein
VKLKVRQLVKNFSAFYGTRSFITAFTRAHDLSWARSIHSMLPIPLLTSQFYCTTIYVSVFQMFRYPQVSHQYPICTSSVPVRATCFTYLTLLNLIDSWNISAHIKLNYLSEYPTGKYVTFHIYIYIYTGCFTTLGHNCRRWFTRSLWWKKSI